MRALALDTTTREGSIAIVDERGVVYERVGDVSRPYASRLPGDVLDALAATDLRLADLDCLAIVSGPGGFTGLRVGIAAMQGFAHVARRRIVAIPTLVALAASAAERLAAGTTVGVWMDARRGEIFAGLWSLTDAPPGSPAHLEEREAAWVGAPEAVGERWAAHPPAVIVGDGATLYRSLAESIATTEAPAPLAPVVARMARLYAEAGLTVDPAGLQPVYVRRPDVEVTRDLQRAKERAAAGRA
jgi:tRNA threonylcarbamoyladenosine biosynthesis protein TsaB